MKKTCILALLLLLVFACAPKEQIVIVDGTQGCSLMIEYATIVEPAIAKECEDACANLGASYTIWQCSTADLLECVCK